MIFQNKFQVMGYVNKTVDENRVEMAYIVNTASGYGKTFDVSIIIKLYKNNSI